MLVCPTQPFREPDWGQELFTSCSCSICNSWSPPSSQQERTQPEGHVPALPSFGLKVTQVTCAHSLLVRTVIWPNITAQSGECGGTGGIFREHSAFATGAHLGRHVLLMFQASSWTSKVNQPVNSQIFLTVMFLLDNETNSIHGSLWVVRKSPSFLCQFF